MAVPIHENLDRLVAECMAADRVLICFDFDGTLVPILQHPNLCELDPALRAGIAELTKDEQVRVAIVSGRKLADLRLRVGVNGASCAGNHGLEIETPFSTFCHMSAIAARSTLDKIISELHRELALFPGVWVEDKGLSVSVHFRKAELSQVPMIVAKINQIVAYGVNAGSIVLRIGKAVREVRPAVDWNKGSAVHWLAAHLFPHGNPPLIMYFGDDDTDEDVFRELISGLGILVGDNPSTAAKYTVRDHQDVRRFVEQFVTDTRVRRTNSLCFSPGQPS